jgi:hypothetical protein
MAAGDTAVATALISLAETGPAPAGASPTWTFKKSLTSANLTFFRVPGRTDILRASGGPEQQPFAEIKENQMFLPTAWKVTTFFLFNNNSAPDVIKWGQVDSQLAPIQFTSNLAVLPQTGIATVSNQPSSPASALTASSAGAPNASTPVSDSLTSPTASPTSAPSSQGNSSSGIAPGAVAGAAIGCLIAGALIAGLIFWFCWGKRKPSRGRDYEASALMPHEKGFAPNAIPLGSGSSAAAAVAGALPLPLEDKAVTGEISKISNSIKNHVQSYYQMGRVSPGLIDLDDIHALGSSQPISPGTLSTLLDSATTREIALRFCIAWVVCSRMQPGADSKTSLLPIELAGCMGKMTNERRGSPGKHDNACNLYPN